MELSLECPEASPPTPLPPRLSGPPRHLHSTPASGSSYTSSSLGHLWAPLQPSGGPSGLHMGRRRPVHGATARPEQNDSGPSPRCELSGEESPDLWRQPEALAALEP
ncbi:hypothetical protein AAY473_000506 [Plecturocebus cupreus]